MKLEFIQKDVEQFLTLCPDENVNSCNTMLTMWSTLETLRHLCEHRASVTYTQSPPLLIPRPCTLSAQNKVHPSLTSGVVVEMGL